MSGPNDPAAAAVTSADLQQENASAQATPLPAADASPADVGASDVIDADASVSSTSSVTS